MKKIFFAAILIGIVGIPLLVAAQSTQINISQNLPGGTATNCDPTSSGYSATSCNPAAFINNLYQFALLIGGILAFGAVVYGGILYMTSAGNPSGQHEGRAWIESALLGLLLLAAAYLILDIINPNLVNLSLPTVQNSGGTTGGFTTGGGTNGGGTNGGGTTGGTSNCTSGSCQSLASDNGVSCKYSTSCSVAPAENAVLNCIQQATGDDLRVTEAYPPTPPPPGQTQTHLLQCHSDGCCVDLTGSGAGNTPCSQVQAIVAAAKQCGATQAVNEFPSCGGSGYNAQTNPYWTSNNIHIAGCQ